MRKAGRARKRVTAFVAVMGVLAIAGVAVAAVLYKASIGGSGTITAPASEQVSLHFVPGTASLGESSDKITCEANQEEDGSFMPSIVGEPGSWCDMSIDVNSTNTSPNGLLVQDVRFTDGIRASFPQDSESCGAGIPPAPDSTRITIRFQILPGFPYGPSNPDETAGVFAADLADWSTACPTPVDPSPPPTSPPPTEPTEP